MICDVCGVGERQDRLIRYSLASDNAVFVVERVPAIVCDNCGETSLRPDVVESLQATVWKKQVPARVIKAPVYEFKVAGTRAGKFEVKKSKDGQFYFNLKAGNGEVILTSEMYRSKPSALNGVASVRNNATLDARYERKASADGQPFFVLKAGNYEVIGQSEMYRSERARDAGIERLKQIGPAAAIDDLTVGIQATKIS